MNFKDSESLDKILLSVVIVGIISTISIFFVQPNLAGSVAAVTTSIFTLAAVLISYITVREMRRERIEKNQPFIFIEFQIRSNGCVYYSIKNLGAGVAKNISIRFSPSPVNAHGVEIQSLPMFQSPIPVFGPSAEICSLLDFGANMLNNETPTVFNVKVDYFDESNNPLSNSYDIDVSRWKESILPPATTEDYLKKISEKFDRMETNVSGIKSSFDLITKIHEKEILSHIRRSNSMRKKGTRR